MAESEPPSLLGALPFVNPQRQVWPAGRRFATVTACRPEPLPTGLHDLDVEIVGAGRCWTLPQFHEATASTSLLVVVDGVVVHEWYAAGLGPEDLFLGASMSKSVLAHTVGMAVRSGALGLDDQAVAHVPELRGTGYDGVSVRHLITMTTGVDWVEDHRDSASLASTLVRLLSGEPGSSRALLAQIGARDTPGTHYEYCTADSQVLDWVRERATGTAFLRVLAELWDTMGCVGDAAVGVDASGTAFAGGGMAARTRDWAKVGLVQLDGGGVLDGAWVDESSRPSLPFLRPGRLPSSITTHAGFGHHWWPLDDAGRRVTADGSRGQFTYVDRDARVVVVKTSQWPFVDWLHDRQCRDLSYLALPAIAEAARHTVAS